VQWGATPLEDNVPSDSYYYQLSVYTGVRKGSGTKSKPSLILSGDYADTGVRRLFDGKRKVHALPLYRKFVYFSSGHWNLSKLTASQSVLWPDSQQWGR